MAEKSRDDDKQRDRKSYDDDDDVGVMKTKSRVAFRSDSKGDVCRRTDALREDDNDDDDKLFSDSDDAETDEDEDGDDDESASDDRVDMAEIRARLGSTSGLHRRSVVSSLVTMDKSWSPPVHRKSKQDEASICKSVRRNLLFANISHETQQILVDAMEYIAVQRGTEIIRQGDAGDLFYILDSGVCEVEIHGRVVGEVDGTSDRNFFGELALLYDAPRAATIRAVTDVECWSLDRVTFKRVLMETAIKQRKLYLDFIGQVPIFATLSQYEQMIVADALRVEYFDAKSVVIDEGSAGDDFYIVEDGEVKCTNKRGEEVSARLGSGDFFGELALVTNDRRMATVTAVRKTKCLVLDRKTFQRLLGPMQEHLRKRADLYELYMQTGAAKHDA